MKKRLSIFLIFVLLFSLSSTTVASALPNKSELPGLYAAEDGDMFILQSEDRDATIITNDTHHSMTVSIKYSHNPDTVYQWYISVCHFLVSYPTLWYNNPKTYKEGPPMSRADEIFQQNCRDILENGVWDTDQNVRPHWEDGTPAHTVKKFGIINRYDLRQEFPILTIRRTYFKTCIDELLWIWQKKSNNIHDLRGHIWDSWADENGSIGKAYGYQLGVKHQYPEGAFDQVDRVLYDLRHNPASRRIMTNLYNFQDLHEMALYPCAYSVTFNVSGRTLNAILNQRSQDMLTANNWNVVQYAVLVHMMAQASGLEAGELVHVIADAHIYDRHVPLVRQLLERQGRPAPAFVMDPEVTDFYRFTRDSFRLEGYDPLPFDEKIPVAI